MNNNTIDDDSLFQKLRQIFIDEEDMDYDLKKEAVSLIKNILRYVEKDAKDIMTHRKHVVAVDDEETLEDTLTFMLDQNFSRFPVYHEDIDQIEGFLHLRDVTRLYLEAADKTVKIAQLKEQFRPVTVVPETKSIDTLFREMQASKNHLVLVLDEYGQTSGLVSMEDILEELVGDIFDEHDIEEKMVTKLRAGKYIVNGMIELEHLEELLPLTFDKEEYETLNGFLISELDHIPKEDEQCVISYQGHRFMVLSVDDNTIERVKIEKI